MISLGYWTSSVSEWHIENVASTFAKLFRSMVEKPDSTIGQLDMVSERDSKQISDWNGVRSPPVDACVHEVIEEQALARPDAQAVYGWDATFTYEQLNASSAQLAHHLVSLGVGPEVTVPLCFEKSAWTIVAMLAVMKAGGVFVPLDPSHPVNRLSDIVQELNTKLILSSAKYSHLCTTIADTVYAVGPSTSELPKLPGAPCTSVKGGNAAYIIFTSGTTGKPKGTVIEHVAYCTGSAAHGKRLLIGPSTRVLQFASYAFDASLLDILTSLMYGGCICIPDEEARVNDLIGFINAAGVNWMSLTPSFVMTIDPLSVPGVQVLVMGGEPLTKGVLLAWASHVQMFNAYGPSECSVISATSPPLSNGDEASNIGYAVGGTSWIVNSHNHDQLVPVGCVGELLIEGFTVARGYLNNEKKTAEAFIESPAWAEKDMAGLARRFYKTGDLVRYNSNGSLSYVARRDTQVKLHGQRLELGEIEHHLMSDNSVMNALVIMPKKGHSRQRLVAVITLSEFTTASAGNELKLVGKTSADAMTWQVSRLRQHISGQLPAYMVPSIWIAVEDIPLDTSGKINRSKVVRWVENMDEETYHQIIDADGDAAGPRTVMDRSLQDIISRVLNLPSKRVALNQSFLSLGGDSITAMQIVSRSRAEGIALRVQDILQSQTISQLALMAKNSSSSSVSREDPVDTAFDLSPIQQMYFAMTDQKMNRFNQSFFLRLTRDIRAQDVARAIEVVVRQHSMLRARFMRTDGRWHQIISKNVSESYHFMLHEVRSKDEVTSAIASSQARLNIETGPLFAADMFNLGDGGQLLFLVAHHLVIDLVSWRVVLRDIEDILESGSLAAQTPFPFQAWCKLQAEHARGQLMPDKVLPFEVKPADLDYWGMTGQRNLSLDAVSESFSLDVDMTNVLLGKCQEALGTEPVEVFLATLLHSFGQTFSDRSRPTVFSEGHGREPWDAEIDLSDTVGWFTTMSPLHVPMVDGEDVIDTVRRTKDTRRELPGNGWPYFASRFLNAEGIEAFKDHLPMEILFNYLGRYQQLERKGSLLRQEELPRAESVSDIGRDLQRLALFEVSVVITEGSAQFSIVYNHHTQHRADIGRWMSMWQKSLYDAVPRLFNMEINRTLSDFPLLSLTYAGLDKLRSERLQEVGVASFSEVEDVYPCSPMQQGMLLSQTKQSGAYEVQFKFEVVPVQVLAIETDKLVSAWQQLVDRHAALRTVFVDSVSEDGFFDQIVLKRVPVRVVRKESAVEDSQIMTVLNEQLPTIHGKARPPHRLTVCHTASRRVFCKLEINHALMDAASMAILLREFSLAYEEKLLMGPGPLYSDYIKYIFERPLQVSIDYWKDHLAGTKPCHFPLVRSAASVTRELRYMAVELGSAPNALHAFCEANRVTVANIVQTAWALVLRAYTGSEEVCFGYLASGRDAAVAGIEEAVGPFINMLVCRMKLASTSCVRDLVKQVQTDYLAGLDHQHCSLAQIQHALNLSGRPLFNTLMSVQRGSSSPDNGDDTIDHHAIAFKSLDSHDPTEVSYIIIQAH
jgi:amino acid adenylation domain-containing protein/non-ribosomal peptide synthase protein (TIGR01720 family)